jgi:hypothetical protein
MDWLTVNTNFTVSYQVELERRTATQVITTSRRSSSKTIIIVDLSFGTSDERSGNHKKNQ